MHYPVLNLKALGNNQADEISFKGGDEYRGKLFKSE